MIKKNNAALLTMLGLAMAGNDLYGNQFNELSKEDKKRLREMEKDRKLKKEVENKMRRGLKPFEFDGEIIWALNEENAKRKYQKLKS